MTEEDTRQEAIIERAAQKGELVSDQDHYREDNPDYFFTTTLRWADEETPPYKPKSRTRDKWLIEFVRKEPHLNGVLSTATSLVANRGWKLVGGRNLVNSVRRVLHDADRAQGHRFGKGWRHYARNGARAFYNTDMGFVSEIGREGNAASGIINPMRALWSSDPTRFQLTGHPDGPLQYHSKKHGVQTWKEPDFFRITNNPVLEEEYHDLGYCAISVVIEVAKILIAVYRYDQEQLGAIAPQGLLLLRNISQRQWNESMKARKTKLAGDERKYFGGVAVLASLGPNEIDAKLVALSDLPRNFDRQNFITLLMYLYSLVFGFSPDEFWPVQIGWLLGRNTEAELGLERATQKGDADFFMAFQDRFQRELPSFGTDAPSVLFLFDERNDRGRLMAADVAFKWSRAVSLLYETGLAEGEPLLERDQALRLLVDQGIVPAEYTDIEEDTKADDTHAVRARDRARSSIGLTRYAEYFPSEPIILYEWPFDRSTVLWENGSDLLRPRLWQAGNMEKGSLVYDTQDPHPELNSLLLPGNNGTVLTGEGNDTLPVMQRETDLEEGEKNV
jgi:hypothetical protein